MLTSLIGFAVLLVLILVLRVPIAFALAAVGFVGYWIIVGAVPALSLSAQIFTDTVMNYELAVVPLFILMGNLVSKAGLSHGLYAASHAFLGHRKGGLATATIVACGGFSAICGSSLATAATMAKVALPPMRKYGYADSLATASIASGGTLGILIPPSVILVIYGFLTETSIRDLFTAGFLPGLLGVFLYIGAVRYVVWRHPEMGPRAERMPWPQRFRALFGVIGTVLLFVIVIGGIYSGFFTPNEAAGVGATGALFIAIAVGALTPRAPMGLQSLMPLMARGMARLFKWSPIGAWLRGLVAGAGPNNELWKGLKAFLVSIVLFRYDWRTLISVFTDTARTTSILFVILIGAKVFTEFVNRAGLPDSLKEIVTAYAVSAIVVMLFIMIIYIILGCVFESLSMLLLTIPVFFPIVIGMADEFGMPPDQIAVWFGIVAVVVTEISLITPPVGLNVFVLSSVLPDVKTSTIFKGVTPFWTVDIIRLLILLFVPGISLLLPNLFFHCDRKLGFPYSIVCPANPDEKQSRLRLPGAPEKVLSAPRYRLADGQGLAGWRAVEAANTRLR